MYCLVLFLSNKILFLETQKHKAELKIDNAFAQKIFDTNIYVS